MIFIFREIWSHQTPDHQFELNTTALTFGTLVSYCLLQICKHFQKISDQLFIVSLPSGTANKKLTEDQKGFGKHINCTTLFVACVHNCFYNF